MEAIVQWALDFFGGALTEDVAKKWAPLLATFFCLSSRQTTWGSSGAEPSVVLCLHSGLEYHSDISINCLFCGPYRWCCLERGLGYLKHFIT